MSRALICLSSAVPSLLPSARGEADPDGRPGGYQGGGRPGLDSELPGRPDILAGPCPATGPAIRSHQGLCEPRMTGGQAEPLGHPVFTFADRGAS